MSILGKRDGYLFVFVMVISSFFLPFKSSFSTTIKERLTEGGASGAFFFYSKDEKLIAKSCSEEEFEVLGFMAPSYADYMLRNKKSYIGKIFGAYRLKIYGNSLHFFVMNNLFFNKDKLTMNEKYDIKGSWVARNAKPPIEGKILTCSYCEQKFVYRKSTKKTRSDMRTYSGSFSA
jgi:1-phosphatidylinositol-4-phosphate 5-kinase